MLNEIPNFLYELLIKQYGEKLTNSIIEGYSTKRPLTIRINKIKTDCDKIKDILNANNIKYKEVSFYKDALIIENYNKKILKIWIYTKMEKFIFKVYLLCYHQ